MPSSKVLSIALLAAHVNTALAGPSGGGQDEGPSPADLENIRISYYLAWVWAAIIGTILGFRITLAAIRYVRRLACISASKQSYFALPDQRYSQLKRHVLHAALFRKRHHHEIRLSDALNIGTLPSRFQAMFLAGYLGINVAFCVISIDWNGERPEVLTDLRNRTGVLAVLNMLPLFLLAGRNNPLIYALDVSFDTYNLIHRWIGRIVVLEALAHTLAWTVNKVETAGWNVVAKSMAKSQLIMTGTIGTFAFIMLLLHSPSVVRHAYYEVFLHVHVVLAATAVAAVWIHLKTLPQQGILSGVVALWLVERLTRMYKIVKRNFGRENTKAEVEAMPGDAIKITLKMARPWKFQPGQYVFLYIPSVGLWTSHPFSLAWSEEKQDLKGDKGLPMDRQDILRMQKTTMSLIVRRRTGFTDKMWRKAEMCPDGKFTTSALVEGPYGNQTLDSYGTVMLFAAGVGITHQIPHIRHLIQGHANGTAATRKVILAWIIRSPEHLEWIRPWMTTILGMEKRREILRILLFVTRPRNTKEIHSPSASVQMFPGKPDVDALVGREVENQVGAMCVSVCGTGSLSDDVRKAVNERCESSNVDFVENAFSW
ncbi:hypothetical protein LTR66_001580 [Elasticomyces elasticus]|nr:hypothetical protein LTR66_001580 [Elasticomyces elasticus]